MFYDNIELLKLNEELEKNINEFLSNRNTNIDKSHFTQNQINSTGYKEKKLKLFKSYEILYKELIEVNTKIIIG